MPDRVKEAIFSILGTMYDCPGKLPSLRVADAFAGSGSLGLEALSRGAASCCFMESKPLALDALRKNLDNLQVGPSGVIVTRDAWTALVAESKNDPFDLVFLDPPYVDSANWNSTGQVPKLLSKLAGQSTKSQVVMVHHEAITRDAPPAAAPWRVIDHRVYGTNAITFLNHE